MLYLLSSLALADDALQSAELIGTAQTMGAGEVAAHLVGESKVGVMEGLEIKHSLGLLTTGGPNLGVEIGLLQSDQMAVSLEPSVLTDWSFKNLIVGGMVRTSLPIGSSLGANLGLGATFTSLDLPEGNTLDDDDIDPSEGVEEGESNIYGGTWGEFLVQAMAGDREGLGTPIHLGIDVHPSDRMSMQVFGRTNVATLADVPYWRLGFRWVRAAYRGHRLALGFEVVNTNLPRLPGLVEEMTTSAANVDQITLGYPTIDVWWRI